MPVPARSVLDTEENKENKPQNMPRQDIKAVLKVGYYFMGEHVLLNFK